MKKIKHQCPNCKFYRPKRGAEYMGLCKWKPKTKIALPYGAFISKPDFLSTYWVRGFHCDVWEQKEK